MDVGEIFSGVCSSLCANRVVCFGCFFFSVVFHFLTWFLPWMPSFFLERWTPSFARVIPSCVKERFQVDAVTPGYARLWIGVTVRLRTGFGPVEWIVLSNLFV